MSVPSPRFYVYVLTRPHKKYPQGQPFYVGKGTGDRVYEHEREARGGCDCRKCRTIRKTWREGGHVQRTIIFTTDDEQEALAYEIETIALYGRKNLTNMTDGGEGASGRVYSSETRAKLSAASKAASASPEARAKLSIAAKKAWAPPEQRAKIVAAHKITWASPEARARQGAKIKEALASPARRAKMSAAATARASSPEERAKMSARTKAQFASPEARAKLSARAKAQSSTPEERAKRSVAGKARFASPEARAAQSVRIRAAWARIKQERQQAQSNQDDA